MRSIYKAIAAALLIVALAAAVIQIPNTKNNSHLIDGEQLQHILESAEYPTDAAETAVLSAASIVGKVHYFWGGKSFCMGMIPNGTPQKPLRARGILLPARFVHTGSTVLAL